MLPLSSKILFFLFALIVGGIGAFGFYRLFLRIKRGAPHSEARFDRLPERIGAAILTSITQERVFRRRTGISLLHSFIFYGFTYYLLVNVIDGLEGYFNFHILSSHPVGALYNALADLMSFLVYVGVIGLVIRRLWMPSKRDFKFNGKSLLHPWVQSGYIKRDSLIVSVFILFHIGSRLLGNAAKMVEESRQFYNGQYDTFQPFATFIGSHLFHGLSESALEGWRVFGYWGALASVLAFLSYFPYTKHIHLFMAPLNYTLKRPVNSGTLPPMQGLAEAMEQEDPKLGAQKLEDLEWPRLLDAYACIQCNRCQDVCPANATGKALSPAALEINKRMELNELAMHQSPFVLKTTAFENGKATENPLLEFAINEESLWACTTCGACMQVCPVQDEQMLDIIDIRRQQVMVAGEFPAQLQTAFRGMERAQNPWGISRDKRFEWADGLKVPTIDENPEPDVLYWVGCAASYDPGAQKVARSFVQLLDKAGVNYAVLGKKEACTGDSARRAGNEFLFQTLAQENVETLNTVSPKLIVATCPHCMNTIGNEYPQLGGHYDVMHHTEYLETLVAQGALQPQKLDDVAVTYHDPCYLGRHNGVYDAPRNVIRSMGLEILELERGRENSFCCGAGGAQFWKEEEEGEERISDNRFKEIQARLDAAKEGKVLAVGCPFCKAMFNSTPEKQVKGDVVVKDVAELMLEGIQRASGEWVEAAPAAPAASAAPVPTPNVSSPAPTVPAPVQTTAEVVNAQPEPQAEPVPAATERKKWGAKADKADDVSPAPVAEPVVTEAPAPEAAPTRKKWGAKNDEVSSAPVTAAETPAAPKAAPARPKWGAKKDDVSATPVTTEAAPAPEAAPTRKKWGAAKTGDNVSAAPVAPVAPEPVTSAEAAPASESAPVRKKWGGKASAKAPSTDSANAASPPQAAPSAQRPKWSPKAKAEAAPTTQPVPDQTAAAPSVQPAESTGRKKWNPKG